jgi:hypothetical protein
VLTDRLIGQYEGCPFVESFFSTSLIFLAL